MEAQHQTLSVEQLSEYTERVFRAAGIPVEHLPTLMDYYVETSLHGLDTHGVRLILRHVQDVLRGKINATPTIEHVVDSGACLRLRGDNGLGVVVAAHAMDAACARARDHGVGVVAVSEGNHFGSATYFSLMAVKRAMIGLVFSNAAGRHMPHWGSRVPLIANNPLSIGVPAGERYPLVLDMAMSTVARAKILQAAEDGWAAIPSTWCADSDGNAITDPAQAVSGLLRPAGEHKGSGLAVVIGALCSALTGANLDHEIDIDSPHPRNTGHIMIAVDVERFVPIATFTNRVDEWIDLLDAAEPAPGVTDMHLPGHMKFRTRERRKREGIPVSAQLAVRLDELAEELQVAGLPHERAGSTCGIHDTARSPG